MPAKPRNNIARLPRDQRLLVLDMLLDGATYDEVRSALLAAGVAEGALPHNSSFLAYRESDEYQASHAEAMQWRRKATEKRLLADALATGGGTAGMVDLALYEAAEQLRAAIGEVEDGANLAKVANALKGIKGALLAQSREERSNELDRLRADLDRRRTELAEAEQQRRIENEAKLERIKATLAGKKELSLADVSAAMDELVGVK